MSLQIYKASAGSGKTFTLAVEYISLLAVDPTAYRNILAVTFTNKATAEMKQRILSTLYGMAQGLKSADDYMDAVLKNLKAYPEMNVSLLRKRAKEALSNIIHDYSRFHIETIDSFFQSIVRELANELELSVKMKVELDESEVLGDAIDRIIENLKEDSNDLKTIIGFVEERVRENRSWQVEETVKDFGRNIFKENYLIHGEEVRKRITDRSAITDYRQLVDHYLEVQRYAVIQLGKELWEAYEKTGITEKDGDKNIVKFLIKVRDDQIKEATSSQNRGTFSASIEEYTTRAEKWFKSTSKNKEALMPQVESVLMPMLTELFKRHSTYVSHLHNVTAIRQHLYSLMLLNNISKTVKTLNEEGNRFLLSETANFLRNVINQQDIPFIYEKTGANIKHIMIDEFQDTSMLQWGNLKPLLLNSLAAEGSCLIVGDVKQSIYRFRNSDWQILNGIEQDEELKNHIRKIPATYNYRSSRRVVTFNNELFKNAIEILKEDCPALSLAYGDLEQKAKKDEDKGFVRIENIDYHEIDKEQKQEDWAYEIAAQYDEATLQRIQLSVKDLIDNGVNANDITILVRTNKEVPVICDYFHAHKDVVHVKVVSDDAFRLDASPAIHIIICALRVLAEESPLHLATLTHHAGAIPEAFDEQARADLRFKPISEQIEEIYQIFQLHQLPGQDAYLFFFNDVVEQFCTEHLTDLATFLQTWDEKLCEKTIPNGTSDGVRIMTMHKSKGLEFHSVIIPSCSWPIKPKDSEVIWCMPDTAPYNCMPLLPISVNKIKEDSIFAKDRKEEELRTLVDNINVLYVAFTRAKHNLIILTGNKIGEALEEKAKIESAQSFLLRSVPPRMTATDIEGIITRYEEGVIVPTQQEKHPKEEKEKNVMECDYDPLPASFVSHPSIAEFQQSYESDLFITEESDNPQIQQRSQRIRLISLGNLYHSIFQHIHTIEDVPHVIQMLESKGCFSSLLDAEEAQKVVTKLIEDVANEHPEWFSKEWQALNERAILFLENQMLTSKRPDRVVVKDNQAIIIDYKTAQGVVTPKADGTWVVPTENKKQIENYMRLLEQIGYSDIKAYLWYILDQQIVPV